MDNITYNLKLKDGKEYTFDVDIDRQDRREETNKETHSFWIQLSYNQCSNCPLQASTHTYCPSALDLEEIAKKFADIISTERADVWVHTKNRSFFKNCDVQEALKSIFGLIMASGSWHNRSRLQPLGGFPSHFAVLQHPVQR